MEPRLVFMQGRSKSASDRCFRSIQGYISTAHCVFRRGLKVAVNDSSHIEAVKSYFRLSRLPYRLPCDPEAGWHVRFRTSGPRIWLVF